MCYITELQIYFVIILSKDNSWQEKKMKVFQKSKWVQF